MPTLLHNTFQSYATTIASKNSADKSEKSNQPRNYMNSAKGFTYGCDPEMFIINDKSEPVPAGNFLPGTKEEPYPVDGGAIQVDGLAAEINITPVSTFPEFDYNITRVLQAIQKYIPENHQLAFVPSITFSESVFNALDETSKELGCRPDFNAWTGEINPLPQSKDEPFLRTAAGHLHIGFPKGPYDPTDVQHVLACRDLVKQMDWYLGAWSLKHDKDTKRRKLYGKAGAYRPKEYGVEYRTLSNFWLTSYDLRIQVWNRMVAAVNDMRTNFIPDNSQPENGLLIESIDNSIHNSYLEARYSYPIKNLARGY